MTNKPTKTRVVVAMSGGVDSSVVAALLKERGYTVIGVTLKLRSCEDATASRSSCGHGGVSLARSTAEHLGIGHCVLDAREVFEQQVLRPSWEEYAVGRTPNPCVRCNPLIKFGLLRRVARSLGASLVATGHYARIRANAQRDAWALHRGKDPNKDQSYFLFGMDADQLASTRMPLGEWHKADVRAMARRLGLPSAERPESQDACLGSDTEPFSESLRRRFAAEARPGPILDAAGGILGTHPGIHHFTIGQRQGLGVALGRKAWVRSIDPRRNQVVLTTQPSDLLSAGLEVTGIRWSPVCQDVDRCDCQVQIRYRHPAAPAHLVRCGPNSARVIFRDPQRAVTPGQAAVFYDGDRVIGGGWIQRATP